MKNLTKKQKKVLVRIAVSGILLIAAYVLCNLVFPDINNWLKLMIFLPSYVIIGYDILWRAVKNIVHGQIFDENFLMCLATIGAFAIGEYPEAVFVMLFYQIGELFQSYAVGKSRNSISEMMDIRPDYANIRRDGSLVQVSPEEVKIGDIVTVKPGERIPLDGVVLSGKSSLDTAALTGESLPRQIEEGDDVISGCVNMTGMLEICVTKEFGQSTVSKILDLVENASSKRQRRKTLLRASPNTTPPALLSARFCWLSFRRLCWAEAPSCGVNGFTVR